MNQIMFVIVFAIFMAFILLYLPIKLAQYFY